MTTEEKHIEDKLLRKIVDILLDYKLYSSETAGTIAERIIGIAKKEMLEKFDKFIRERTYLKNGSAIKPGIHAVRFMPFEFEEFKKKEGGA